MIRPTSIEFPTFRNLRSNQPLRRPSSVWGGAVLGGMVAWVFVVASPPVEAQVSPEMGPVTPEPSSPPVESPPLESPPQPTDPSIPSPASPQGAPPVDSNPIDDDPGLYEPYEPAESSSPEDAGSSASSDPFEEPRAAELDRGDSPLAGSDVREADHEEPVDEPDVQPLRPDAPDSADRAELTARREKGSRSDTARSGRAGPDGARSDTTSSAEKVSPPSSSTKGATGASSAEEVEGLFDLELWLLGERTSLALAERDRRRAVPAVPRRLGDFSRELRRKRTREVLGEYRGFRQNHPVVDRDSTDRELTLLQPRFDRVSVRLYELLRTGRGAVGDALSDRFDFWRSVHAAAVRVGDASVAERALQALDDASAAHPSIRRFVERARA